MTDKTSGTAQKMTDIEWFLEQKRFVIKGPHYSAVIFNFTNRAHPNHRFTWSEQWCYNKAALRLNGTNYLTLPWKNPDYYKIFPYNEITCALLGFTYEP